MVITAYIKYYHILNGNIRGKYGSYKSKKRRLRVSRKPFAMSMTAKDVWSAGLKIKFGRTIAPSSETTSLI